MGAPALQQTLSDGDASPVSRWMVRRLELSDVRCWRRATVELPEGLIVVHGPNGAGKTSLIEAVVLGALGVSPRTTREVEVVRRGATALHVAIDLEGPRREHREIGFQPGLGRRLSIDGAPERSLGAWRRPGSVLVFIPEELRAVKGPPAARRRHLDRLLEAADTSFAPAQSAYQHALVQRNALLRRVRAGTTTATAITPWDHQLAAAGAIVIASRRRALRALETPFASWLERLGGGPGGALRLESSPAHITETGDDDLEAALLAALEGRRARDIAAAVTLSGPHRDDLWIGSGDVDLRRLGSQGEQRTATLALVLTHRDHLVTHAALPILVLDDVLSELDPDRRRRLLEAVAGYGQTIITAADPDVLGLAARTAAHTLHVEEGRVASAG
jgi:DNA replication and repair protein RecF